MRNESPKPPTFDFHSLRFEFQARGPFLFPPLLSANTFRGALGLTLRRTSPKVFHDVFAPLAASPGPSGLSHPPRPFVFRTRHLDGAAFAAGELFHVDLNLFQLEESLVAALEESFAEIGRKGFGPQRSGATLHRFTCVAHRCDLVISATNDVRQVRIEFLTPMELKSGSTVCITPEFEVLLRRARDRISNLRSLYGPGPLDIDFRALSARAAAIQLTSDDTRHMEVSRRSSRTTQVHPLGGLVGSAEYNGSLSEFLPLLQIAAHSGVGRQTVWGKGEIATQILA